MRKSGASGNKITPNRKLIRKSASRQDLRGLNEKVTIILKNRYMESIFYADS